MMTTLVDVAAPAIPWTAPAPRPAAPAEKPDRNTVKAVAGPLKVAVTAVGLAVGTLGVLGFVNSFHRVDTAAQPSFGALAWTVPIGIDLGILVFSALDIVLAVLDMRLWWLRLIPWTLTVATVYLNVADAPGKAPLTPFDRLAHGLLPLLWVLSVEVGAHVVRKRAGLVSERHMDKVRLSRWILAPFTTAKLRRRMVLWEELSYKAALRREQSRLLAKTDLQDKYGAWLWRWRAPRRARALYRLGELAPSAPASADADTDIRADSGAGTMSAHLSGRADTRPDTGRTPKRTSSRTAARTAGADTASAVARLRSKNPDMPAAEIARRVGVTDRTVRRHLERLLPVPVVEHANGHDLAESNA